MPEWLKYSLIFSAGGVVGFFVSKYVYKKKFEKDLNEQIESVKEAFRANRKLKVKRVKEPEPVDDGKDPKFNEDLVKTSKEEKDQFFRPDTALRVKDDAVMNPPKEKTPDAVDTPDGYPDMDDESAPPFLIRDTDFGDQEDQCEWILWADDVVTADDSICEIVSPEKVAELLPPDWKDKFGWENKYQNQIYYRNNINRLDIAIYKDNRTYKEWLEEAYPARYLEEFDE